MSEKRQLITTDELFSQHGEQIAKAYEDGATVTTLVEKYKCSRNTMVLTLGRLGFPLPKWAQKQAEETQKIRNAKRRRMLPVGEV